MSTVTIFCREGACNVAGHTRANCVNRAAALHQGRHLGSPAEIAAFLRDADQAYPGAAQRLTGGGDQ